MRAFSTVLPALTLLLLFPLDAGAQRARPAHPSFGASVESLVVPRLGSPAPGILVGVMHEGTVVVERGYGIASPGEPAWSGSVFQVGSITKQMTAAAILRLRDEGRLSLDDDIRVWVPSLDTRGHIVTLRHLLTHTSGIPEFLATVQNPWAPITTDEIIRRANLLQWSTAPGQRYSYNNTGYMMLGEVIRRASGREWSEYLRTELFLPLGMTSTGLCGAASPAPNGYLEGSPGVLQPIDAVDMSLAGAAGGICSTVGDLMRWSDGLVHGRVVNEASFAEMTTRARLNDGRQLSYGLGIGISNNVWGMNEIEHGGSILGFQSVLVHDLDQDLVMVVLVNVTPINSAPASDIVNQLIHSWNTVRPRAEGKAVPRVPR